jgi:hypothetical protein
MESIIGALKDTPIPTILVIAGIAFLLLAIAGQLAGRIVVAPERQRWAALIGGGLLAVGLALHIVPQLQSRKTSPPVEGVGTSRPATPEVEKPPPGDIVSPPLDAGPVQSYRIRTNYAGHSDVEFSVFVNDVQVGAYSSDGVTADITRFIKPGLNNVRVAWTADRNMSPYFSATLIIEVKQGEAWSHLITRTITKTTKTGEITPTIFHAGTAPQ